MTTSIQIATAVNDTDQFVEEMESPTTMTAYENAKASVEEEKADAGSF